MPCNSPIYKHIELPSYKGFIYEGFEPNYTIRLASLSSSYYSKRANKIASKIKKSDKGKGVFSDLTFQVVDVIPYVFDNPINGKVSYSSEMEKVRRNSHIREIARMANADMVWLMTRCDNSDTPSVLALATRPKTLSNKRPDNLLTLIANNSVSTNVLAYEFGHLMTLQHNIEVIDQDSTTDLSKLSNKGVGSILDKGKGRYELSLMSYCPNTVTNGVTVKGKCSNTGLYSNGMLSVKPTSTPCSPSSNRIP